MKFGRTKSDEAVNSVIRDEIESIEGEIKKIEDRIRDEKDHDVKKTFTELKAELKKYKSEVVGRRTYNLRTRKTK